jgi:hypothetical protein
LRYHIPQHVPGIQHEPLILALERANKGKFFINPSCESLILDDELKADGILGYETPGYYITHDIYEEWALEKIIESEFVNRTSNKDFGSCWIPGSQLTSSSTRA